MDIDSDDDSQNFPSPAASLPDADPNELQIIMYVAGMADYRGDDPAHPYRRSYRLSNYRQNGFDIWTRRVCATCTGILLSPNIRTGGEAATGFCHNCWRSRTSTVIGIRYGQLCQCPCQCPPESDDLDDDDFIPAGGTDQSSSDHSSSGQSVNQSPQLLARGHILTEHGDVMARNYYEEPQQQDHTDLDSQMGDDEVSSTYNEHNHGAPNTRAAIVELMNGVSRTDLASMLDRGYSRTRLRQQFQESRMPELPSYLPPDSRGHEARSRGVCSVCNMDYTPLDNVGIHTQLHRENMLANANAAARAGDVDGYNLLQRRLGRLDGAPSIEICEHCLRPIDDGSGTLGSDWTLGHCHCRCPGHNLLSLFGSPPSSDPPNLSDSSSSSSKLPSDSPPEPPSRPHHIPTRSLPPRRNTPSGPLPSPIRGPVRQAHQYDTSDDEEDDYGGVVIYSSGSSSSSSGGVMIVVSPSNSDPATDRNPYDFTIGFLRASVPPAIGGNLSNSSQLDVMDGLRNNGGSGFQSLNFDGGNSSNSNSNGVKSSSSSSSSNKVSDMDVDPQDYAAAAERPNTRVLDSPPQQWREQPSLSSHSSPSSGDAHLRPYSIQSSSSSEARATIVNTDPRRDLDPRIFWWN